jgi:hypothetical protein
VRQHDSTIYEAAVATMGENGRRMLNSGNSDSNVRNRRSGGGGERGSIGHNGSSDGSGRTRV